MDNCPACGADDAAEEDEYLAVPYSTNPTVYFHLRVPLIKCAVCGESSMDDRAREILARAIQNYEQRLLPLLRAAQIVLT
jgi:hypothetical protein